MINYFLQPTNLSIFLIWIGFIFYFYKKNQFSILLIFIGTIIITIIGFFPLGALLTIPLEQRFIIPPIKEEPAGIIVLGGTERISLTAEYDQISLNSSAERLIISMEVANKYPNVQFIYSGGSKNKLKNLKNDKNIQSGIFTEADVARIYFSKIHQNTNKIIYDDDSKNTYENAVNVKKLIGNDNNGKWILITSAMTMPRAAGVFQKIGIDVLPYPVDFKYPKQMRFISLKFHFTTRSKSLNNAIYEWVALIAYRVLNRTNTIFPGPIYDQS